jgi:hypothetical protein
MPEKPKNENLQLPCGPGENTNPSCPPTNLPISALYERFAQRSVPEELRMKLNLPEGVSFGDALAAGLFAAAAQGNVPAAREIREGIEGKTSPRRNPEGADKFEIVVRYEDPPLLKMLPEGSSNITTE